MLNWLEAINLQSFNWLNVIPADLLVLAHAVFWPLDASHSCHKWLSKAAPWSYWYSQEQKFLNRFQFSSRQAYSDEQKKTLLLFLCTLPFSIHWLQLQETICTVIVMPFPAKATFLDENLHFPHTKKTLQECSYATCSLQMSLLIFLMSVNRSEELGKSPLSSLQNSANASKNRQCRFRENVLFDM